MKEKNTEINLAITSVMIALITVFTLVIRFPSFGGYISLVDAAIVFSSFAFGPLTGFISAALGTSIADLIAGYPQYSPISFIVHGLQGFLLGLIAKSYLKKERKSIYLIGFLLNNILVAGGYFIFEWIFLYGMAASLKGILLNLIQASVGFILGLSLYLAVLKAYPPIIDLRGEKQ